jgi:hypothetical protein
LDQAAREGAALGAFEESSEEAIAIVEEFFPEDEGGSGDVMEAGQTGIVKPALADKLAGKLGAAPTP